MAREPVAPDAAQRVAAVLVALGRDVSVELFKHFSEADMRRLATGARQLKGRPDLVMAALAEFTTSMSGMAGDAQMGDGLIKAWAAESLGLEVAQRAFEEMSPPPPADEMLGPVATADAESLAMVLTREHPQTIALVLSTLEARRALAVMNKLPEQIQTNVLLRMAKVEAVSPDLLKEVGTALASELRSAVAGGVRRVEGRANALEILRNKPMQQQSEMVGEIEKVDADLAAEIRQRLFTFEDMVHLPDRDIQALLKEFDTKVLMVALKGGSAAVNAKVLKNMSSRAAEMMKDDMQAMGPVRLADVEAAQLQLVTVVSRLATEGRIRLVGPADKMV